MTRSQQEDVVTAINSLNSEFNAAAEDPEVLTRIAQYEMAFKMQASIPELMETGGEPAHIFDLYGCKPGDGSFASNCLLARRLAELAACGSSSSTTRTGTITAESRTALN